MLEFMYEKCKCDLNKACNDGLKPIHAASQCGHTNIVKVLSQYHSVIPSYLHKEFAQVSLSSLCA